MRQRHATPYEQFQWLRHRRDPGDPGLMLSYVYELTGDVGIDRLDRALRETVTTRFPRLSSYFAEMGGSLQVGTQPLPGRVLQRCERADSLLGLDPLDAASQDLCRFSYCESSPGSILLRLDFSHLVFDGECYLPFCQALSERWAGEPPAEQRAPPSGAAAWTDASESYWRERLADRSLHQPLSFCFPAPHAQGRYLSVKETLAGGQVQALREFLRRHGLTVFQFIAGVTGALVHSYSGEDEQGLVIAHTVNTRRNGEAYGCHTNLLPLWLDLARDQTSLSLLHQVKARREEIRDHQDLPALDLMRMAPPGTNRGGRVFNLVVNASSGLVPTATPALRGVEVRWVRRPDTSSPSDLAVNFSASEDGVHLSFDSSSRYLSPETLSAFATNFLRMARFIVDDPQRPPSRCDLTRPLLPVAEGPEHAAGESRSLGAALLDTARHNLRQVAVEDGRKSLSYGDLLTAADQLCAAITAHDGQAGRSIGIFLERSAAISVSYLAAIVLQKTFVPLDPQLPGERLRYMGTTAGSGVILVDETTRDRAGRLFPDAKLHDVTSLLRADGDRAPAADPGRWLPPARHDRTAYVMFTSGSTGNPKAVAVSESNLTNFLLSMRAEPGMHADDRILALTPVGFDISLLEILLPLYCGASVEILASETGRSGALLAGKICDSRATVVQATPSTWRLLRSAGWRSERRMTLLCGGEALDPDLAEYLLQQDAVVYHMYGPTEATIWASWQHVTDSGRIHLGKPARNTRFYVLDELGRSVSPGMRGELVIAGACVGQGYLNVPSTPFVELNGGRPAYQTGDLVFHEGGGRITYVARRDGQRKINGYRVELAEVTGCLQAHAPSATVFTVVREKPEQHLCCFVWLPGGDALDAGEARAWCRRKLPYYMMPKAIHQLAEIPLTPNGKADVKKLAEAPLDSLGLLHRKSRLRAGRGRDETRPDGLAGALRQLIADELDLDVADIDEPLGHLGVDSIGYNLLAARIGERYRVVIHAHDFYRINTLRSLADMIARLTGARPRPAAAARHPVPAPAGEPATDDRLAIIGLSAVLPGGADAEAFWQALIAGADGIRPADDDRGLAGHAGGFLDGIKGFDAGFFSVSPLEASWMDPRQRLLLQSTWHAIEDAGYAPSQLRGSRTGCYIAATGNDYAVAQARADLRPTPYSLTGSSLSFVANRLSSWFDWHGPSFTLDTACSGALTALVKACHDLRAHICDMAVAGGVNLILDPQISEGLAAARFLSPDNRCATFDASANGYVRGEGYGALLVKRLSDAVAANDSIHAVIEGVAENHGGRASSLTAPNPDAQTRLLLDAYTPELAARTGYIETHGTGTVLGDAIEVDALKRAWEHLVPGPPRRPVWLGAVKSNIGHLEPAAGIASIAKIIKAFEHRALPANLHFETLNPSIVLEGSPFQVLEKPVSWEDGTSESLVAGTSSFGFGGSNAHVVLSSSPKREGGRRADPGRCLIPVSARTEGAVRRLVNQLADHVEQFGRHPERRLLDLSYTLCHGREHFAYRQAWLVSSVEELLDRLRQADRPVRVPRRPDGQQQPGPADPAPEEARLCYLAGRPVAWQALFAGREPRRLHLPTYPFDRTDFWFTD